MRSGTDARRDRNCYGGPGTVSGAPTMINVFKPAMGDEEIQAIAEVIRSGWIGLGPKTAEFERVFAAFVEVPHAVALNSCTAALDLALKLLGIKNGDEVIVPTMTFVSTAHAVAVETNVIVGTITSSP